MEVEHVGLEDDPVLAHDATALAQHVRGGVVSPTDLVERCLSRIAATQPVVNACCAVFDEDARRAAAEAESALAAGRPVGPLHGVPVMVKESIWVAGKRSTGGSRGFANFVAPEDAVVVDRLKAAGAIVVAQTTMSELGVAGHTATELFGVTRNPWNLGRSAGGSSGGSAAAVAAHAVPLALGSDAGGSIRKPAAFCGLAGLKPTFGRIPAGPGVSRWQTLVSVGPITRSVRDLALALSVLEGADPRDPHALPVPPSAVADQYLSALPAQPRVAWSPDLGIAEIAPEVRAAFTDAISRIAPLGWSQKEDAPAVVADVAQVAMSIHLAEAGRLPAASEQLINDPDVRDTFRDAAAMLAADAQAAQQERGKITRAWEEFFRSYDLLLTPTVAFDPPPTDAELARLVWQDYASGYALLAAANLTGQPAVTVPVGITATGLPFGLQITGPRGADVRCLAAAAAIEAAVGFDGQPQFVPERS